MQKSQCIRSAQHIRTVSIWTILIQIFQRRGRSMSTKSQIQVVLISAELRQAGFTYVTFCYHMLLYVIVVFQIGLSLVQGCLGESDVFSFRYSCCCMKFRTLVLPSLSAPH